MRILEYWREIWRRQNGWLLPLEILLGIVLVGVVRPAVVRATCMDPATQSAAAVAIHRDARNVAAHRPHGTPHPVFCRQRS